MNSQSPSTLRNRASLTGITVSVLILLYSGAANAAPPIYSQKTANGVVIFSDAPVTNGELVRTSYQAQYGRPVARSSAELIKAVAQIESCFDRKAISRVGAEGVMQLMPATAKELGVVDSFDAQQNINGGTEYLAKMLARFDHNPRLALAAYNAGPGAVDKHKGVPPFPETQAYIEKVLKLYTEAVGKKS